MKKLLLFLIVMVPNSAFAYTGDYCVSGAGTAAVNGTYTFQSTGIWVSAGCSYMMFDAVYPGTANPCGVVTNTAYSELRSGDNINGYYFDSHIGTGTVETFDSVNTNGTTPVPTVTQGACSGGGATTTINRLAKFTATTLGDSLFSDDGSNVILTAGNLFMQIGSLFDTVTNGSLSFGTTNATTMTFGRSGQYAIFNSRVGIGTSTPTVALQVGGDIIGNIITALGEINFRAASTVSNCIAISSPASCGTAPAGSVAMATGGSTLVVNTTAVTANSQIFITEDSSLGTRLGMTCNTSTNRSYTISARTPGTSFTIKSTNNPVTNKACLSYWIIN